MVAYSVMKRFVEPVQLGLKDHTIRAERAGRSRHARPGEPMQLYTAMRTKHCRKIIDPDPICIGVHPIRILRGNYGIHTVHLPGVVIERQEELDLFARSDGFEDLQDMSMFWDNYQKPGDFFGVLIKWTKPSASLVAA